MGKYVIILSQGDDNVITFEFNRLSDALQFAETCLECGDPGTVVTVKAKQED